MNKIPARQKMILILFGLLLSVVLLEALLRIGGFVFLSLQEHRNMASIRKKGAYRIMCIGESTTVYQYPSILEDILNKRNAGIRFSVVDKGVPGVSTSTILSLLENNLNKYNPDMVIAMMGINDMITYTADIKDRPLEDACIFFIESSRLYKLVNLLRLNISTILRGRIYYGMQEDKPDVEGRPQVLGSGSAENADLQSLPPQTDAAFLINLGRSHQNQNEYKLAQECFEKAIAINPRDEPAYLELARSYMNGGRISLAQESAKKAIEINPGNRWTYFELGVYYQPDQPNNSEKYFRKAIELDPKNDWLFTSLAWLYLSQGKLSDAENLLVKALLRHPKSYWINASLASLYREIKKPELVVEYEKRLEALTEEIYYSSMTVNNYHKIKDILDKRNIKLVCVQYPVRSIKPLKRIFKEQYGIIFVDNEQLFKDALKGGTYREYFLDMFAGDFGHCTLKGNQLLARNIADVIINSVFDRKGGGM